MTFSLDDNVPNPDVSFYNNGSIGRNFDHESQEESPSQDQDTEIAVRDESLGQPLSQCPLVASDGYLVAMHNNKVNEYLVPMHNNKVNEDGYLSIMEGLGSVNVSFASCRKKQHLLSFSATSTPQRLQESPGEGVRGPQQDMITLEQDGYYCSITDSVVVTSPCTPFSHVGTNRNNRQQDDMPGSAGNFHCVSSTLRQPVSLETRFSDYCVALIDGGDSPVEASADFASKEESKKSLYSLCNSKTEPESGSEEDPM